MFSPRPRLIRTLSINYRYTDESGAERQTADDPSYYEGEDRRLREDAILEQFPYTFYADKIRSNRENVQQEIADSQTPVAST